mgnify:CR=1 FL=1
MSLKKGLILLGLIFLLTSIVNANEAQDLLRKARDEYYKSIEGQEKAKKEAARLEKERIAKEEKAAKEAERANKAKAVEKEEKKVYIDEEVEEEAPKPKTAIEKLEYNSEKALERVDYYERVVRSVAREEEELKEYKNTVKNKK